MTRRLDSKALDQLVAAVHTVIADRRQRVATAVDDDVLQLACAAMQDLQEIHAADPSDALSDAIDKLRTSISALRAMLDREALLDSELTAQIRAQLTGPLLADG